MTDYQQINALAAEGLQLWGADQLEETALAHAASDAKRAALVERLGAVPAAKGDPASR